MLFVLAILVEIKSIMRVGHGKLLSIEIIRISKQA